jgi:hypothetical protein
MAGIPAAATKASHDHDADLPRDVASSAIGQVIRVEKRVELTGHLCEARVNVLR